MKFETHGTYINILFDTCDVNTYASISWASSKFPRMALTRGTKNTLYGYDANGDSHIIFRDAAEIPEDLDKALRDLNIFYKLSAPITEGYLVAAGNKYIAVLQSLNDEAQTVTFDTFESAESVMAPRIWEPQGTLWRLI